MGNWLGLDAAVSHILGSALSPRKGIMIDKHLSNSYKEVHSRISHLK